jgi:hypothetical protein
MAISELRRYTAIAGKEEMLLLRFQEHTLKIFERLGFELQGFWLIPEQNRTILYVLRWQDEEHMKKGWAAFAGDPAWVNAKDKSEENGPIVRSIMSELLVVPDFANASHYGSCS